MIEEMVLSCVCLFSIKSLSTDSRKVGVTVKTPSNRMRAVSSFIFENY